ncbi:microtubule-destabilizing protein 60-like [Typha angustifolia]|uniref:microtubule-destabilizing protein 60-like n=1 Tax=Typha angustifolia TaxID=59011 RepID=UPI003C2C40BF
MGTPAKKSNGRRIQTSQSWKLSENSDPNLLNSGRSRRPISSTKPRIRISSEDKKFVATKKNSLEYLKDFDSKKNSQVVCKAPRAPLEDFFAEEQRIRVAVSSPTSADESNAGSNESKQSWVSGEISVVKDPKHSSKMSSVMLDEDMSSIPAPGAGRVMHLVKAFERLLSLSNDHEGEYTEERKRRVMNWALPCMQQPPRAEETELLYSPVSSSSEFTPTDDFERDCRERSSAADSGADRRNSTSDGWQRNISNNTNSSGRRWNRKLRVTSQQPFKLRTEQRGRIKEENFLHKVREILEEEEKLRVPIAQGLPWTTDEPECLLKPPVKEPTESIDFILHTDVRAAERAEFDLQVAEHISLIEQCNKEKEMQQKMEEEEEIHRLRRELVPRAQPMPKFDRPFIPKMSSRPKTIPKEPRFQARLLRHDKISSAIKKS